MTDSELGNAAVRIVRRVTEAMLIIGIVLGVSPLRLLGHGGLKSSVPAAGAHLAELPRAITLVFTERPELRFTSIRLLGPDSVNVRLGTIRPDSGNSVVAEILGTLAAGVYAVVWQTAGADGHPVRGRFRFTIAAGAEPAAAVLAASSAVQDTSGPADHPHHDPVALPSGTGFDAESPGYVAIRWLGFLALVALIGAAVFRLIVLRVLARRDTAGQFTKFARLASARAAQIGFFAAIAALLATVARLVAQSYALHGRNDALDPGMISSLLAGTTWGRAWLLQIIATLVALVGFRMAVRGGRSAWTIAGLAALVLSATPALSGHAVATPRITALAVIADTLHVLGAGGWLGGLLVVLLAGIPAALKSPKDDRSQVVAHLVNAFSPTALSFAALVTLTGVFAAWVHLESFAAIWTSAYGRTLLLKLGILSVVVATGAYNWLRVRPALGTMDSVGRLRRSARLELVAGALVLLVTAALIAIPMDM